MVTDLDPGVMSLANVCVIGRLKTNDFYFQIFHSLLDFCALQGKSHTISVAFIQNKRTKQS